MATTGLRRNLRSALGRLVRAILARFGWRGHRAQIQLYDLLDRWSVRTDAAKLGVPLQPWLLAPALPAGTVTLQVIEPQPPTPIAQPIFYGPSDMPHTDRRPITDMHVQPRHLHQLPRAYVLPQHVLLDPQTQRVVPHPLLAGEVFPHNGLRIYPDATMAMTRPIHRRDLVMFDRPVFVADTSHHIYGHVLLEVLPRLMLLAHCPPDTAVLTSILMRPPYPALFEAMGVPPDRVVSTEAPALCATTFIADSFVDLRNFVAPQAWDAFAQLGRLASRSSVATHERIYVSRRKVGRRPLRNEAEIETLFERHGFAVIQPESLPIEDQVKLFSAARCIAGPGGSALHNMIFAPPEARVLILAPRGLVLPIDALLTRTDGALGYVLGQPDSSVQLYTAPWTVDAALVEAAIEQHFGL